MKAGQDRPRVSVRWRDLILAAVLALTMYLAANPIPRDAARTFLTAKVIPGLRQVDPFLVGDKLWAYALNCRVVPVPADQRAAVRNRPSATRCENLLGQVIRLPGALVHTAQYVIGTGWPGIAVGVLTMIIMGWMVSGSLDNPLVWPLAVLMGSLIAGIVPWVLQWTLIVVAGGLAWLLWAIAALAGSLLAADWALRGLEMRRAIAAGAKGAGPGGP